MAAHAEKVLEAQYQDAVRQRIDDVYSAYVTALAARQTLRYARESVRGLTSLEARTRELYRSLSVSEAEWNRVRIQLRTAQLGFADAEAAMRKARLDLGTLMNLTNAESRAIELRGTIDDAAPPPPALDQLQQIALDSRPDLAAYRLGLGRARADVKLANASAYNDVYLLYQPYTFQDNQPFGLKSTYGWAVGMTVTLPLFNRNQGGIQRANLNVTQSQLELDDLRPQILVDVEKALEEYQITRREVEELRREVVPVARQVANDALKLYLSGETSIINYINAQLEFNQIAKQYLDTAVRHRLSMLDLNTATGRRLLP
ncbi:MAG: TolC family protein [Isosphaeraceae bacterium]